MQEAHQDYAAADLECARGRHPGSTPASEIVALIKGTKLLVYPGCFDRFSPNAAKLMHLEPGECLMFHGDLIYCGVGTP